MKILKSPIGAIAQRMHTSSTITVDNQIFHRHQEDCEKRKKILFQSIIWPLFCQRAIVNDCLLSAQKQLHSSTFENHTKSLHNLEHLFVIIEVHRGSWLAVCDGGINQKFQKWLVNEAPDSSYLTLLPTYCVFRIINSCPTLNERRRWRRQSIN